MGKRRSNPRKSEHIILSSDGAITANEKLLPAFSYSLRGWEDGQPFFKQNITRPDRWLVQSSDSVTIHFNAPSAIGDVEIEQDPHSDELGGYLWTSSMMMAFWLEAEIGKHSFTRFLELGAGCTGLPSIVLNRLGKHAVCTDIGELVPQLKRNLGRNRRVAFDDPIGCDLDADELYWQEEMMEARKVVMRLFDKHFSEYWLDAILMADCIYSEASARALVTTLRAVVEENWRRFGDQRSVEIYCISELRNQAAQDEFLSFARQFGFEYRLIPPAVWNPVVPEECRMDYVNFYRLWFRGVND